MAQEPCASERSFQLDVLCPTCGKPHRLDAVAVVVPQPIYFGGGAPASARTVPFKAAVTCPIRPGTNDVDVLVPVSEGDIVKRVTVQRVTLVIAGSEEQAAPPSSAALAQRGPVGWLAEEIADWRKRSAETLRRFASKMVGTSTGGIAIYFSVLKYVGVTQSGSGWRVVAGLPPLLLLSSAATFVLALRPGVGWISDEADYARFRRERLQAMNRSCTVGTALFLVATLAAVIIYLGVLL